MNRKFLRSIGRAAGLLCLGAILAARRPAPAASGIPKKPRTAVGEVIKALGGGRKLKSIRTLTARGRLVFGTATGSFLAHWTPKASRVDFSFDCGVRLTEVSSSHPWKLWYDGTLRRTRPSPRSPEKSPAKKEPPINALELGRWLASNRSAGRAVSSDGQDLVIGLEPEGTRAFELRIRDGLPSRLRFEADDGPVEVDYSNFQAVGDLRLPFSYMVAHGTRTQAFALETMTAGVKLPPGLFEPEPESPRPPAAPLRVGLVSEEDSWFAPGRLAPPGVSGGAVPHLLSTGSGLEAAAEEEGYFLLDTGAPGILIASELVPPSSPSCAPDVWPRVAGQGSKLGPLVFLKELHVGPVDLSGLWVFTVPGASLSKLTTLDHRRVLGILGRDFFDRFAVELDPAARRLTLHPPGSRPEDPGFKWLPLGLHDDQAHAEARVQRRKGIFLMDTAAGLLTLSPGFAAKAGLAPGPASPEVEILGLHGNETAAEISPVSVALGPLDERGLRALVRTTERSWPDGVIGRALLDKALLWWDYSGGELGIKPLPPGRYRDQSAIVLELERAENLLEDNDAPGALRELERLEIRHPGRLDLLGLKARAYLMLGRDENAVEVFFQEFLRRGDSPGLRYEFVLHLARARRYALFSEKEELLLKHPDYRNDRILLGMGAAARLADGRRAEALAWAQKAAGLFPWDSELKALLKQAGGPP